jgi:hypothetical protein
MAKPPDRAMLSGLVDAYERIAEESLGMGDPEFHEVEARLYVAIADAGLRAVIKGGSIGCNRAGAKFFGGNRRSSATNGTQ